MFLRCCSFSVGKMASPKQRVRENGVFDAKVGANKQQLEIPLDVVADIPTKVDSSVSWTLFWGK